MLLPFPVIGGYAVTDHGVNLQGEGLHHDSNHATKTGPNGHRGYENPSWHLASV